MVIVVYLLVSFQLEYKRLKYDQHSDSSVSQEREQHDDFVGGIVSETSISVVMA
jgi:hypothetical protein